MLATLLSTVEAMVAFGSDGEEVVDYSGTQQREGPGMFFLNSNVVFISLYNVEQRLVDVDATS